MEVMYWAAWFFTVLIVAVVASLAGAIIVILILGYRSFREVEERVGLREPRKKK